MAITAVGSSRDLGTLGVFHPERTYFGRLAATVNPLSLLQPIFERYPFQPPFPASHPALRFDYSVVKSINGAKFFLSYSERNEASFHKLVKERSRQRDIKQRLERHEMAESRHQNEFVASQLLAERLRALARFRYYADHALNQRRVFFELLAQSYHKSKEQRAEGFEMSLARLLATHEQYWEDVRHNLIKKPRPVNIATLNLQTLMGAMPSQANKARIIQAIRRVKRNIETAHAEPLAERLQSGAGVPTEVYSHVVRSFHRPSHARDQHKEGLEERYRDHLATQVGAAIYRADESVVKRDDIRQAADLSQAESHDAMAQAAQQLRHYRDDLTRTNQEVMVPLPLASTNKRAILALFGERDSPAVLFGLSRIDDNQTRASAAQISAHADRLVPAIPAALHTRFRQLRLRRKLLVDQGALQLSAQRSDLLAQASERRTRLANAAEGDRRAADETRAQYWHLYDHLHHEKPGTIIMTTTNAAESSRQLGEDGAPPVMRAMQQAKKRNGMRPHDPITSTTVANSHAYHADAAEIKAKHPLLKLTPKDAIRFKLTPEELAQANFTPAYMHQNEFAWRLQVSANPTGLPIQSAAYPAKASSPPPDKPPHFQFEANPEPDLTRQNEAEARLRYRSQIQTPGLSYASLASQQRRDDVKNELDPATNDAAAHQSAIRRQFKTQALPVNGISYQVDASKVGSDQQKLPSEPQKKIFEKP